ncbi:malate dehydrogenase-like [Danaus plexippus]|nr:malate dehydrogenase-like [Danaus plexippus]
MFQTKKLFHFLSRHCISRNYQVTVVGGASEIGQTVGLLLRTQPAITKLIIHDDLEHTPGVVLDLSHIPSGSALQGVVGGNSLEKFWTDSSIIIATGGVARSPGTSKETWFNANVDFIKTLSSRISKMSPMPFVGIATEPINTLVPMAAEIMKNHGEYDPKKMFGITILDKLKTEALYAAEAEKDPQNCNVPVIGGHSEKTLIPLLSQAEPKCNLDEKRIQEFTSRVRSSDSAILKSKCGWSPSLSVAYGAVAFTKCIMDALDGRTTQIQAYVENNDFGTSYFSGLVTVDQNGVKEMQSYSNLSSYECQLLERSIEQLRKEVLMGKKALELE